MLIGLEEVVSSGSLCGTKDTFKGGEATTQGCEVVVVDVVVVE